MPAASTGLTRVTINSPQRRVDVALPDAVPLAELLPELLQHAGADLADDGQHHGGWLLRRGDGTPLAATAGLGAAGVRDGEVLHLAPVVGAACRNRTDDLFITSEPLCRLS